MCAWKANIDLLLLVLTPWNRMVMALLINSLIYEVGQHGDERVNVLVIKKLKKHENEI